MRLTRPIKLWLLLFILLIILVFVQLTVGVADASARGQTHACPPYEPKPYWTTPWLYVHAGKQVTVNHCVGYGQPPRVVVCWTLDGTSSDRAAVRLCGDSIKVITRAKDATIINRGGTPATVRVYFGN